MIKHIVMFEFKNENKVANLQKAKELLEGLFGKIDALKSMEVGVNFSSELRAMDMSIITLFDDIEGLNAYAIDEEHLKVVAFIKEVTHSSKVVDYVY